MGQTEVEMGLASRAVGANESGLGLALEGVHDLKECDERSFGAGG
jgi:hypothetical protein